MISPQSTEAWETWGLLSSNWYNLYPFLLTRGVLLEINQPSDQLLEFPSLLQKPSSIISFTHSDALPSQGSSGSPAEPSLPSPAHSCGRTEHCCCTINPSEFLDKSFPVHLKLHCIWPQFQIIQEQVWSWHNPLQPPLLQGLGTQQCPLTGVQNSSTPWECLRKMI